MHVPRNLYASNGPLADGMAALLSRTSSDCRMRFGQHVGDSNRDSRHASSPRESYTQSRSQQLRSDQISRGVAKVNIICSFLIDAICSAIKRKQPGRSNQLPKKYPEFSPENPPQFIGTCGWVPLVSCQRMPIMFCSLGWIFGKIFGSW